MRRRPLEAHERAVEIGRHDVPPLGQRHVQGQRGRSGSRVIHEHVEAAEAIAELVDDVPAASQVRGVQVRQLGFATSVTDLGRCV
jgi:hypothetical protein